MYHKPSNYLNLIKIKYYLVIVAFFLYPSKGIPSIWNGRFNFGSYASTERFKVATATGSDKNDFQTLSTRFYLKGEELGPDKDWDFISDLRDKHDFFDKLDSEKLSLKDRNDFQIRQMSVHLSHPKKFWGCQLGRFPVTEVGSTFVDGLSIENHWTESLYSIYFAGLNPQIRGRGYLEFDKKAQVQGVSLTYQNLGGSWDKNLFISHGVVEETYDQHKDRNYIFQNLIYQWRQESRLMSFLYYDLIPRSYVQNGNISWQQELPSSLTTDLTFSRIDVIEYNRNKEILETLPSSPYEESRLKLTWKSLDRNHRIYLIASSGLRKIDHLKRQSSEIGYIQSQIFGPKWDFYLSLGTRKNFTSDDQLLRGGVGYYDKKWELNLDVELQKQTQQDGTKLNPLIADASLAYNLNRESFLVASGQSASNENVKILSGFFKYGYRFGSKELPPLRDGAPPRGPL